MTQPVNVPGIWELLSYFKDSCRRRGWKTSDYENIVKIDDEYHDFIGTRTLHPSTFNRIVSVGKRAVPEGKSYRVIDVDYTAWVFQQPPSEQLVEALKVDSKLSKKIALYDLSGVYQGKSFCLKLNDTGSLVFDEFERFLKKMYDVETKPLYEPRTSEPKTFKSKLQKASVG